jgi:undecaprenyl diphosphate synthase
VKQSTLQVVPPGNGALHVAIIMDGNGRWAAARRLPRTAGHRAGARALRRVLEAAPDLDIRTLTVYALSADNWQRPRREVSTLLRLLRDHLLAETEACLDRGVRVSVIGRRDRLPLDVLRAIEEAERLTRACTKWHLRIAVDYSARQAILDAAVRAAGQRELTQVAFSHLVADRDCTVTPDVDLLIRTGGEQRLSDFLLWECAYAELLFTRTLWPDFGAEELRAAVAEFHCRDRRFGGLGALTAAR